MCFWLYIATFSTAQVVKEAEFKRLCENACLFIYFICFYFLHTHSHTQIPSGIAAAHFWVDHALAVILSNTLMETVSVCNKLYSWAVCDHPHTEFLMLPKPLKWTKRYHSVLFSLFFRIFFTSVFSIYKKVALQKMQKVVKTLKHLWSATGINFNRIERRIFRLSKAEMAWMNI